MLPLLEHIVTRISHSEKRFKNQLKSRMVGLDLSVAYDTVQKHGLTCIHKLLKVIKRTLAIYLLFIHMATNHKIHRQHTKYLINDLMS